MHKIQDINIPDEDIAGWAEVLRQLGFSNEEVEYVIVRKTRKRYAESSKRLIDLEDRIINRTKFLQAEQKMPESVVSLFDRLGIKLEVAEMQLDHKDIMQKMNKIKKDHGEKLKFKMK